MKYIHWYRSQIMMNCWERDPKARPSFMIEHGNLNPGKPAQGQVEQQTIQQKTLSVPYEEVLFP